MILYQRMSDTGISSGGNFSDYSDTERKGSATTVATTTLSSVSTSPSSSSSLSFSKQPVVLAEPAKSMTNLVTMAAESDDQEVSEVVDSMDPNKLAIHSLTPVVSPMSGTMVELSGRNIDENASILVDGVMSDFVEFLPASGGNVQRLFFLSPRLLEGGFKTVQVCNPDNESAKLENVLCYSEENETTV